MIARSGTLYPILEEALQRQLEIGIRNVVIDPPSTGENPVDARRDVECVAMLSGLERREPR